MCLWFQLTGFDSRNSQKQPKRSQKGEKPQKIPDFIIKSKKWPKIVENGQKNLPLWKRWVSESSDHCVCDTNRWNLRQKIAQNNPKEAKMAKNREKIPDFVIKLTKWPKIYLYERDGFPNPLIIVSVIPSDGIWGKSSTWEIKFICCNFDFKLEFCCITWFRVFLSEAICCIFPTPKKIKNRTMILENLFTVQWTRFVVCQNLNSQ